MRTRRNKHRDEQQTGNRRARTQKKKKKNAGQPQLEGHGSWLEHLVRQPHVPATKTTATETGANNSGKKGERGRPGEKRQRDGNKKKQDRTLDSGIDTHTHTHTHTHTRARAHTLAWTRPIKCGGVF